MSSVTVEFNVPKVKSDLVQPILHAQVALDIQVLKDSNFFCPEDTGNLQASGITATKPGTGVVEWNTPYAREQYYSRPNKSLDRNPNARMKWFEEAKARRLVDWVRISQRGLST